MPPAVALIQYEDQRAVLNALADAEEEAEAEGLTIEEEVPEPEEAPAPEEPPALR